PAGAPVFTPDTPLAEVFPELTPKDGETVVKKRFPGSFAETDLQEVIAKTGLRKIVLVGYMARKRRVYAALGLFVKGFLLLLPTIMASKSIWTFASSVSAIH
ncbi:hypothetical protein DFH06DRAFT_991503, partial [Mycena polygramma]